MKTLSTLVLLALICFLHRSSASPVGLKLLDVCCVNTTQRMIPIPRVKHVMETPAGCPTKAIVVKTVCDEQECIDRESKWAKHVMREFKKFAAKRSPHAPFNSTKCDKPKKKQ